MTEPLRPGPPRFPAPATLPDTCGNCRAARTCCQCRSDVGDLRRFARRMAELHQRTGTAVCGCGAYRCHVRQRLDDIRPEHTP